MLHDPSWWQFVNMQQHQAWSPEQLLFIMIIIKSLVLEFYKSRFIMKIKVVFLLKISVCRGANSLLIEIYTVRGGVGHISPVGIFWAQHDDRAFISQPVGVKPWYLNSESEPSLPWCVLRLDWTGLMVTMSEVMCAMVVAVSMSEACSCNVI